MSRLPARRMILASSLGTLALAIGGCAAHASDAARTPRGERAALAAYLREVEPLRLAVNRLLEGADPILSANHDGTISPARASIEMGRLERRFAGYTRAVNAIVAGTAQLRSLQAGYAHTYIQEDSYLSALTVGLGERDLDGLPNTESEQRIAIIAWRVGLEVLARRLAFALPADLQLAGRGEIRPSPAGS
jgi:hypothetical protein